MKRTYKKMSFGVLLCFLAVSPVISAGTGEEVKEPGVVSTPRIGVPAPIPATTKEVVKSALPRFSLPKRWQCTKS